MPAPVCCKGSAGIHSALLAEVPMVILSGESISLGEDPKLAIEPQWYRSLSIVGGPQRLVEPVTKWATQVGSVHTLYEHVVRAGEFAQRTPRGPVYLNAPLEVMLQEWTPPEKARQIPPAPRTRAKDADVEKIAELIINARNPVILADTAGRDPAAFAALVEFAELYGIPIGSGRGAVFANFPKNHELFLGTAIDPFLKDSDLVLLVGCKAPWYPPSRVPTSGTIVAIDENPLKGTMVYQSQQADHYLEGEIAASLRLLVEAARAGGVAAAEFADRRALWRLEHERAAAAQLAAEAKAMTGDRIEPSAVVGALREAMPSDAIYVEETITHAGMLQQHLPWSRAQSFFRPGGGLGQGLGMALGVKLGSAAASGGGTDRRRLVSLQPGRPGSGRVEGQCPAGPDHRLQQRPIPRDAGGPPAPLPRRRRPGRRYLARRHDRRPRLRRTRPPLRLPRPEGRKARRTPGRDPQRIARRR